MIKSAPLAGNAAPASELAHQLLGSWPERWQHTVGVALRAQQVAITLDSTSEVQALMAAAWLHDIGYAPALRDTGFHPLDGARHLEAHGWPARIAGLVAHHSAAAWVARARGLADEIDHFTREQTPVSDALTYADQTVGPYGRVMTIDDRMADMLHRHGPDSPNAAVHPQRAPVLRATIQRVQQRLAARHQPDTAA